MIFISETEYSFQALHDLDDDLRFTGLKYYARDIGEELGFLEDADIQEALNRAVEVCEKMKIPVEDHFREVYRAEGERMIKDVKVSSFGSTLLLINGRTDNIHVARAQWELLKRI